MGINGEVISLSRVDEKSKERNKTMVCPGCGKKMCVNLNVKLKYGKKIIPTDPCEEITFTATPI